MGNFLIIQGCQDNKTKWQQSFTTGAETLKNLKGCSGFRTINRIPCYAAKLPRLNGTGEEITEDRETGSWMFSTGTWFYQRTSHEAAAQALLKSYLRNGDKIFEQLEGFFVISLYDGLKDELVCVTDIAGGCHAYFRALDGVVALSSSSLILAKMGKVKFDTVACGEFLSVGTIFEDRTLYKEVKKLQPATIYRFKEGRLQETRKYWTCRAIEVLPFREGEAIERYEEELKKVTRDVISTFKHPLCDLTGGYDSRAILAGFLAVGYRPAVTVTGEDNEPDVLVSKRIAEKFSLQHFQRKFGSDWPGELYSYVNKAIDLTEGEYDVMEYARILRVHQESSKEHDITINGSYGEISRGYWWELLFPKLGRREPVDFLRIARKRYVLRDFSESILSSDLRLPLIEHFAEIMQRANHGLEHKPNTLQLDNIYINLRMQRWQGRIASATNQVWPCLSPFMLRPFLETALSISPKLRRRSLLLRYYLKMRHPQLAEEPLANGIPALPVTFLNFPRFFPLVGYYRERLSKRMPKLFRVASHEGAIGQNSLAYHCRKRLWEIQDVLDLLNLSDMKSLRLYQESAVENFLRQSSSPSFAHERQFGRLLALEMAARFTQAS